MERMQEELRQRINNLSEATEMLRSSGSTPPKDGMHVQKQVTDLRLAVNEHSQQQQKYGVLLRDLEATVLGHLNDLKVEQESTASTMTSQHLVVRKRLDEDSLGREEVARKLEEIASYVQDVDIRVTKREAPPEVLAALRKELLSHREELTTVGGVVNQCGEALDQGLQAQTDKLAKLQEQLNQLAYNLEAESATRAIHIGEVHAKVARDLAEDRVLVHEIATKEVRALAQDFLSEDKKSREGALEKVAAREVPQEGVVEELQERVSALEAVEAASEDRVSRESEAIRDVIKTYFAQTGDEVQKLDDKCTELRNLVSTNLSDQEELGRLVGTLSTAESQIPTVVAEMRETLLGQLEEERRHRAKADEDLLHAVSQERYHRTLEFTEQRREMAKAISLWHQNHVIEDDEAADAAEGDDNGAVTPPQADRGSLLGRLFGLGHQSPRPSSQQQLPPSPGPSPSPVGSVITVVPNSS
jgi:hypothetical protein